MAKCTSCGKSGLLLKTNVEGMCPECQLEELSSLRAALTPEQREIRTLQEQIRQLNSLSQELDNNINCKKEQLDSLDLEIKNKKVEMVETDEAILLQSFGFYKPQYDFINSETYKDRLDIIRKKQKEMITAKTATTGFTNWTVDGSSSKGKTMVNNVLSMDKDDVATFEKLRDLGVTFDVRKVPNDSKKDLFDLINKANVQ